MLQLPFGGHLRSNAIRQHFLRFGARGPRLVVVPGIISPAMLWAHVGDWLGAYGECFVLDVRGRGLSEAGTHLDYGLDACAQDLACFVRDMDLGPVIVVGHSMGARIAARAAVHAPERLRAMVLIDPPTSGPGRRNYPIPMERTLGLLGAAHRGEADATLRASPPWPDALQRIRAEWLPTCDARAVRAAYADFHSQDLFADIAASATALSLVRAGRGGVVSDDDIAELRRLRPGLRVAHVPDAGHQMQAENFASFSRALGAVLSHHDRAFEGMSS